MENVEGGVGGDLGLIEYRGGLEGRYSARLRLLKGFPRPSPL